MSELLLILSVSAAAHAAPSALPATLVQSVSPRVHIVRAEFGLVDRLRADPAVELVTSDEVPPEIMASLTSAESLFVKGWQSRREQGDKARPGEGLSWDAPGFEPPDPPAPD